jgi:hypothetical protein
MQKVLLELAEEGDGDGGQCPLSEKGGPQVARMGNPFQVVSSVSIVSRNSSTRLVSSAAAAGSYAGSEESAKRCSSPG